MPRPRRAMSEINVVPYIDVMLVLLVIFMVTAPMMTTASIDVPSVGKAATPPAEALQVNIRADQIEVDCLDEFAQFFRIALQLLDAVGASK